MPVRFRLYVGRTLVEYDQCHPEGTNPRPFFRRAAADNLRAIPTIRGTGGEVVSKLWWEDTRRASPTVLGNWGKTRDRVYRRCRPRSVLPTKQSQWQSVTARSIFEPTQRPDETKPVVICNNDPTEG